MMKIKVGPAGCWDGGGGEGGGEGGLELNVALMESAPESLQAELLTKCTEVNAGPWAFHFGCIRILNGTDTMIAIATYP